MVALAFAHAPNSQSDTCFPDLPAPHLVLTGTVVDTTFTRFNLSVSNWSVFPAELFEVASDLPPCGLNPNASRTWVDIFADGVRIFGFCALGTPQDLTQIWFAIPQGQLPPSSVFITLTDRRCGLVYTSNSISIAAPNLTCPAATTISGCNLSGIGSLPYSEAPVMITLDQLKAEGGDASAACGIASITYQDSRSGNCPNLSVNRTLTLTDLCNNTTSCQQSITFGGGGVDFEIVVPNSLANVEGNSRNFIPFFQFTRCYQQVYDATQFNFLGPRRITRIAFRPDSSQAPFDITLSQVEIRLSTTTQPPDGLKFFCVNEGRNEKIVRRAKPLTLRSSASGPVEGPKRFDIVIRIAGFLYDPAEGNLLLEIRNTGTIPGGSSKFLDASNVLGDPVSRVWERAPNISTKDTIGLVTKFSFAPQ